MRRAAVVWLLAAVVVAGGCVFPDFGAFGGFSDDEIPMPSVLAVFADGSASLEITQAGASQTVSLDSVGRGSQIDSLTGSTINWRNGDGWVLVVTAYDFGGGIFGARESAEFPGDVTIERIQGGEFWRADSYGPSGNRCIVDVAEASETVVRGTATCRALTWTDGVIPPFNLNPVLIEGQEPFDAEITFEARP